MLRNSLIFIMTLVAGTFNTGYSQNGNPITIESWVTNPDRSSLFQKQPENVAFRNNNGESGTTIIIDEVSQFQEIDGFGFALTGGSAELLMKMTPASRTGVLREIFATNDNNIGVSNIRMSIGASDFNSFVFSYDDLKSG